MALYRKYRPATFAEVVGQEHVTAPLSAALRSGRINHAYLFSGPRGCGKTSSARILARSLNCVKGPTPEPCGVCESCIALAPGGPGNLDVIELDAASHGKVDDTRELREKAFFAPASSRYRVLIIDEAHMVSTAGFNALLKIVEEPPEHLIFIFATTEPEKVLPTIKSRTHHYPFRLLTPTAMRGLVERIAESEGVAVEPAVYPLVIRQGGGSPRDTLSVLDQLVAGSGPEGVTYQHAAALLGVTESSLLDATVEALATRDSAALFRTVDRVIEVGHDPRRFVADLLQRLRDVIMVKSVPQAIERGLVDAPGEEAEALQRQAEMMGEATLSRLADEVHSGLDTMRGATSPRLLLEILCARLLLPEADESVAALQQRVEQLERGVRQSAPVAGAYSAASSAPAPESPGAGETASSRGYVRPSQRRAQQQMQGSAATAGSSSASAQPDIAPGGSAPNGPAEQSRAAEQIRSVGQTHSTEQVRGGAEETRRAAPDTSSSTASPASQAQQTADTAREPEARGSEQRRESEQQPATAATERPAAREQHVAPAAPSPAAHTSAAPSAAQDAVSAAQASWADATSTHTAAAPARSARPASAAESGDKAAASSAHDGTSNASMAAEIDAETIRNQWPKIRQAVRERSRTLEVMLADATVVAVNGTNVVLNHKTAALANRLNEPHHAQVIAAALSAVLGERDWTTRVDNAAGGAGMPRSATGAEPQRAFSQRPAEQPAHHDSSRQRGTRSPAEHSTAPSSSDAAAEDPEPSPGAARAGWAQRTAAHTAVLPTNSTHTSSHTADTAANTPSAPATAAGSHTPAGSGFDIPPPEEPGPEHFPPEAEPTAPAVEQAPPEPMPEVTEDDMVAEARSGPQNMDHRTPEELALALLKEHLGAVPLD